MPGLGALLSSIFGLVGKLFVPIAAFLAGKKSAAAKADREALERARSRVETDDQVREMDDDRARDELGRFVRKHDG